MTIEHKRFDIAWTRPQAETKLADDNEPDIEQDDEAAADDSSIDEDVILTLSGYAATYEDPSNPDSWGDIFAKGAFTEWLEAHDEAGDPLPMMDDHGLPVGAWTTIKDDPDAEHGKAGLWVEGEVYDAYSGPSMAKMIKKRVIKGLSVGFRVQEESFLNDFKDRWGFPVRQILKSGLVETSPTPFPANTEADIQAFKADRMARRDQSRAKGGGLSAGIRYLDMMIKRAGRANKAAPCSCQKGENLTAALESGIDAMVTDDMSRADVVEDMGTAAGISAGTVNQILNGTINCPPLSRLEGFATALGVSLDSLISAAEGDGCSYGDDDEDDDSDE